MTATTLRRLSLRPRKNTDTATPRKQPNRHVRKTDTRYTHAVAEIVTKRTLKKPVTFIQIPLYRRPARKKAIHYMNAKDANTVAKIILPMQTDMRK